MKLQQKLILILALMAFAWSLSAASQSVIKVGSKKFTESVILGEIITQHLQNNGLICQHRDQLGGTRILWKALLQGNIDIYPDYTGTIIYEILQDPELDNFDSLRARLAEQGISITAPLGFNNTYALGSTRETADKYQLNKISDLLLYPELRFGFTNEFMDREDGWPSLQAAYHLPQTRVRGLDHDLAYKGLEVGSIDLIDLYSTDAEIAYYQLHILQDDRQHFPDYHAVILYRSDLKDRFPGSRKILEQLSGTLSNSEMVKLNSAVKLEHQTEAAVAHEFLIHNFQQSSTIVRNTLWSRLLQTTKEHLFLVLISLSAAILIAIPLGIWGATNPKTGQLILSIVGVIQTIPSLALLVFMIPLLGIGGPPALVALFLYSLLPIVRNTLSGLSDIPLDIRESALALGLPARARLRLIELPLATRSILAGLKTSAVINVGTATLGALIGAGGYGQPILTGIRLDDTGLILEGAIPAAVLALLVQGAFDLAEHHFLSPGLNNLQESHS